MLRRHFLTALTVTSAAALTGCGIYGIGNPGVEDVVGRWIETTPGVTGEQGYVFAADGKVTSFGFAGRSDPKLTGSPVGSQNKNREQRSPGAEQLPGI